MAHPIPPFDQPVDYNQVTTRAQQIDLGTTPRQMREGFTTLLLGEHSPQDERPLVSIGDVEVRLSGRDKLEGYAGKIVVWFHGGGYVFGSPETHLRPTNTLAELMGCPVVSPRYRLAPEHQWPAQLEDASAVVHALQAKGCQVIVAGDSAGGHLAINVGIAFAKTGNPLGGLLLFSPNTDRSGLNSTRAVNDEADPIVGDAFDRMLAEMCFPPAKWDAKHPEVSPLLADLSLLPRTHIEVAGRELLRDDSILFYAFAKQAGAAITLHETPAAFHMWQVWTPWLAAGTESLARAAEVFSARK